MNNFETTEEECQCIVCDLTDEFKTLIQDGVDWESALRHVLGIATKVSDEQVADTIDEVFRDGMIEGIRQSAEYLIDIADVFENGTAADAEKVEDLTDEQFEDVQDILRRQITDN